MGVVIDDDSDDLDVTLLDDRPTLFRERLLRYLNESDTDRVIKEIADICQGCWDADAEECDCSEWLVSDRRVTPPRHLPRANQGAD